MTTNQPETIMVAIQETSVFDVLAYHAHCLRCDWHCWQDKGHDGAHPREATAVKHAGAHLCNDLQVSGDQP